MLEIGAGIGFISTLLSRERRVSSVLAVEANPHLIDYMARLHARNRVRKVRRLNAVLTNEPVESMTFYLRRDFWMGSLMPGPNPYVGTVEVPTMQPRRASARRGDRPDRLRRRGRRGGAVPRTPTLRASTGSSSSCTTT